MGDYEDNGMLLLPSFSPSFWAKKVEYADGPLVMSKLLQYRNVDTLKLVAN